MNEETSKTPGQEPEDYKTKSEEYLNNWKRERADFLNYKRDESERMMRMGQYAKEKFFLDLLPILDHLELAEKELPDDLKRGKRGDPHAIEWTKGFLQIRSQVRDFLKKEGIEEVRTQGKKFDHATMEIISEAENGEPGTVAEELQKGYMMDGKVLRAAKVKVVT